MCAFFFFFTLLSEIHFLLFFLPVLLSYNWHVALWYMTMIWLPYIMKNYHIKFSQHSSTHMDTKLKKQKFFFLMMRTVETYSSNISYINIIIFIMLCITSLVFVYLITGSLYLLTAFIHFPLLLLLTSSNHKSDFFFWVCFWNIVGQHYVSSWCII